MNAPSPGWGTLGTVWLNQPQASYDESRARLGQSSPMKVMDETFIHIVSSRNPRPCFRPIAFPVNQVLESPSTPTRANDTVYRIRESSTHEARGGWRRSRRHERTLSHGLNLGDVERRVYPHGPGKLKSDRHRTEDFLDDERTNKPGGQLVGFHVQRKVLGGQPDLLALLIGSSWGAVMVC